MRKSLILASVLLLTVLIANCNETETPGEQTTSTPEPTATAQTEPATETKPDQPAADTDNTGVNPKFEDYAVSEVFEGKTAPLVFTSETKAFRTRFQTAAAGSPNFAGRYIVTTWGCGTDCLMGGVIDAKTGSTHMIPFSICCLDENVPEDTEKVDFQKDSKLIVFNGLLDEKDSDIQRHFYLFENNKFVPVSQGK